MAEFKVNTYINNEQKNPTVAMDADGDFVIAWTTYGQDGSGFGIYAQRYNSAGIPQGNEFQINTSTSGDQINPTVAIDSTGDFVISWQSQDESGNGIYAQRYNSAGVAQGGEFKVNTSSNGEQINPTIAMDADGDFVISWQSKDQDGSGYGIYAQRYNSAGVAQGNEFRVNTYTIDHQSNPSIAMDGDGDFVISWQSYYQDNSYYGIYAQRYNSAGVAQGGEFKVNTYTLKDQRNSTVAMDAVGNFIISWSSLGQDGASYGIYAQRYNSAGVAQGGEFKVNTYTTSSQDNPTVAINASTGDFIISWQSLGQDGSNDGIYAQRYNSAGVAQGNEFQVNTYTQSYQNSPTVAMASNGEFVISWQSLDQDGSVNGIYAQLYNSSNAPPQITLGSASALTYTENATTAIDSGLTVSDTDSTNLASATVSISSGFISGEDTLAFTNQNGITGSYNSSTGVLTLTGSSTVANYQAALRSITYNNSSDNPTTTPRTISFLVNDGSSNSTAVTRNINITAVNDAPVAVATNSALSYTENATTAIDSAITLIDVDSTNLVSATVSISSGFVSGEDVLAFTNQNGISGSYNSSTGVLTLTGSSTVANYQTALRSITYTNTSDNPTTTPRTISFLVNDGSSNSTAVTRNINITAVNDAPVVANPITDQATTIDTTFNFALPANTFTDVDTENLTYTAILEDGNSLPGWLTFNGTTFSGTPTTNNVGTLSIKVIASDGTTSVDDVFVLTITDPNNPAFNTINGTSSGDKISGTQIKDFISGLLGNDSLIGLGDNDTLDGGDGNDTLDGGTGNDSLIGGKGNDTYIVDSLSDVIIEGLNAGTDVVKSSVNWVLGANIEKLILIGTDAINGTGNNLKNVLTGNSAANILNGADGNDSLIGGAGNDSLIGGAGNDTLDGGVGNDTLNGGAGDDTYIVDSTNDVIIEGLNAGKDLVKSSVTFVLADNVENLTLTGSSAINGTGNNLGNILTGNTAANYLNGADGNDSLVGGKGNDTLVGGAGNDFLDGGVGDDSLDGGAGDDIYIVDSANDVVIEGSNAGTDLVKSAVTFVLGNNLENLTLTGSKVINGTGNSLNNIITGNGGANILSGEDGNDSLIGGAGNDTLVGGAGDDELDGGTGDDSLDGGMGNDTYTVNSLNDTITEGSNAGTDLVKSSITWVLGNNLENLTLTGSSAISGTGNNLNNIITGNTGANLLSGEDGDDSLFGGSGIDTLLGGAGNDVLIGGIGKDVLTGGTGQDSFYLTDTRTGGFDTITDFTVGNDTIFISKAEFALSQSVNTTLDSSIFRLGTAATAAGDRFIYDQTTGNLFFDKDGSGSAAKVQIALFSNQAMLTSANITVIA
ncbi:MAG: beta strand repeat-containing protein [Nostoc sp. ZfuVER08]|nr:putative Ig domain-containing protein [Nostoc sp. ZfuVER08]